MTKLRKQHSVDLFLVLSFRSSAAEDHDEAKIPEQSTESRMEIYSAGMQKRNYDFNA